jgi:4-alpha-glucanotransferase
LFDAVESALGPLPLIAEDLGDLSPRVPKLRNALGLPGMKLLQDGFRDDDTHNFLPHRYPVHCVAYTGTHDNNTSAGWYESAPAAQRAFVRRYLDWDGRDPAWTLIRAAWESAAMFAVAPLQDFLRLGADARMNTPATVAGNWQWRATAEAITDDLATEIRSLNLETGRVMPSADSRTENRESR